MYQALNQCEDEHGFEWTEEYVDLRMRIVDLETENMNLRYKVESQKKLLESLQDAVIQATIRTMPDTSESVLNTAVIQGELKMVALFLESEENKTPALLDSALQSACQHHRAEIAELLIQHGANIHADHDCALMWACHSGDARIVRLLIKHGANSEALNGLPMRIAIGSGKTEVIRALSEKFKKLTTCLDC